MCQAWLSGLCLCSSTVREVFALAIIWWYLNLDNSPRKSSFPFCRWANWSPKVISFIGCRSWNSGLLNLWLWYDKRVIPVEGPVSWIPSLPSASCIQSAYILLPPPPHPQIYACGFPRTADDGLRLCLSWPLNISGMDPTIQPNRNCTVSYKNSRYVLPCFCLNSPFPTCWYTLFLSDPWMQRLLVL